MPIWKHSPAHTTYPWIYGYKLVSCVWPKTGRMMYEHCNTFEMGCPVAVHPATRTLGSGTESYIHSAQHTILFPINQNHPLLVGENFLTRIYYALPYIKSVCARGYSQSFFTPLVDGGPFLITTPIVKMEDTICVKNPQTGPRRILPSSNRQ